MAGFKIVLAAKQLQIIVVKVILYCSVHINAAHMCATNYKYATANKLAN
jgi:hypothetical protein